MEQSVFARFTLIVGLSSLVHSHDSRPLPSIGAAVITWLIIRLSNLVRYRQVARC